MSNFWIGTVDEYNQDVKDIVELDITVKKHSPIYSPDYTEVLVKGFGDMDVEDVRIYKLESKAWTTLLEEYNNA